MQGGYHLHLAQLFVCIDSRPVLHDAWCCYTLLPVDPKHPITSLHATQLHLSMDATMFVGASVHVRDHWKQTPLHVAAMEGHRKLIKFLLKKKADTNVIDCNGNTPLDITAERNHRKATGTLLKNLTPSTKDKAVKRDLEMAMKAETGIEDDLVAEKIRQMSRLGYVCAIDVIMLYVVHSSVHFM